MSDIETLSDESEYDTVSDVGKNSTEDNKALFRQMIELCRKIQNKNFPQKYIEDMSKMYKKCNDKQKNSSNLCNLILKGIKYISPFNKNAFTYAANVYNELLQLSKKDLSDLQTENSRPSTSNGSASNKLENETNNHVISKSNAIFKELIEKCYQNEKFPKSNIEAMDKLYKSLPAEFFNSKYFVSLLKEANQVIWPDSKTSLYVHVEHVYNQLLQFEASMKVQNRKISDESKEINSKKLIKLAKLKKALKETRKRIKKLEEEEMDINNEDEFNSNSAYVLLNKYEKRALELYRRMCKLKDEPDFLEEPPLRYRQTNNNLVNKTIEKFYNLNKVFPDYFEIYTLLKLLNEKKKLKWTETELKNISSDAFLKLGKQLKIRRLNEYFSYLSNVTTKIDPAESDAELRKKLEESNKKLHADLNAVTEEFEKKQEYAEETEGSNLNETDCENSSEDNSSNEKKTSNKEFKSINVISVRRKRTLSNDSDNEPKKKSKNVVLMESFKLLPCVVLEKLDITSKGSNFQNVPVKKLVSDNIDDNTNKNTIDSIEVTDNISEKVAGNYSHNRNLENLTDDESGVLVIDEGTSVDCDNDETVTKKLQEDEVREVEPKGVMHINTINIDNANNELIIVEPDLIINENKDPVKDVIEINEHDDSDVEIMSCVTPKVPVFNKKSLESIIKAMNFEKKYKWADRSVQNQPSNSVPPSSMPTRVSNQPLYRLNNPNQNLNNNLVNRWVMNNIQPRPSVNTLLNRHMTMNKNRSSTMNHQRMQPVFQNTQMERHTTQRVMNTTMQQQRNFMNSQSLLQQVTMTTTTHTVRQIVQQSAQVQRRINHSTYQGRRPTSSQPRMNKTPELIELD